MEVSKILRTLQKGHAQSKTMLGGLAGRDPFYVLISTVLSARSRDDSTAKVAEGLFRAYSTPQELASADIRHLEKLVKKSGFYRVKARRIKQIADIIQKRHQGRVPSTMEELVALPGVGRKTAGCVSVYAFRIPAIPVDTHVHRVSNRLGLVRTKDPLKTEAELEKLVPKRLWLLVNEVFVLHGQKVCKPVTPLCSRCSISRFCKKAGITRHA